METLKKQPVRDIKPYLHLYHGCDLLCGDGRKRKFIALGMNTADTVLVRIDDRAAVLCYYINEIKPILRKLSSMTEGELMHCIYLMEGHLTTGIKLQSRIEKLGTNDQFTQWYHSPSDGIEHIIANLSDGENGFKLCSSAASNGYYRCYVKLIHYLLSIGMDLFNLIESKLAIEKQ